MDAEPLAHAGVLEGPKAYIARRGDNFQAALSAVHINVIKSEYDEPLVPLNGVARFFEMLADRYNDPAFGLKCAELFPRGASGVFGLIVINSKNLRSAMQFVERYANLVVSPAYAGYEEDDKHGAMWWRFPDTLRQSHVHYNMFCAGVFALRFRAAFGGNEEFCPLRVELTNRDPGCIDYAHKILGDGVVFDAPINRMTFPRSALDQPLQQADPHAFNVAKQLGDLLLSVRGSATDFVAQVKDAIITELGKSAPTLDSTAQTLHISPRTLQRKLANNGTNFEKVMSDARQAVADRLLRNSDLQLTEIAFMLGFSELSAFTRAANRWFGMSPREFRAMMRKAE